MHFKEKLAFMALGGALVFAGSLLPRVFVPNAVGQAGKKPSAEFDTVTARTVFIVDDGGKDRIVLGTRRPTQPSADPVDKLLASYASGLAILGNDGKTRVEISSTGYAKLPEIGENGMMRLWGNGNSDPTAVLTATPEGSLLTMGGPSTLNCILLAAHDNGGSVNVSGNDGSSRVGIGVDSYGGFMHVFGNDSKYRVGINVNEYGNGTIETRDKIGYRTGKLP